MRRAVQITWDDLTEAAPAFLTITVMGYTMKISEGIVFGFISYSFLKLLTGGGRNDH